MGTLYLVATPIGNLEDITIRAIKILFSVDYIACEDTRKTGQMLKYYESRITNQELGILKLDKPTIPKFISYYDEIAFKRIPELLELLTTNKTVALVSDSGTPLISDPGFKLVGECLKRGIKIISIPGPTSLIAALTLAGLPVNQFLFLGYLPSRQNKRLKLLTNLFQCFKTWKFIHPTIILFESPHRLKESLVDLEEVFGDIKVVIARELTKIHEDVWRGKISETIDHFQKPIGEFVILLSI